MHAARAITLASGSPAPRTSKALKKPTTMMGFWASSSVSAEADSTVMAGGPVFFLIQDTMPSLQCHECGDAATQRWG